jgi:hypothetical protein
MLNKYETLIYLLLYIVVLIIGALLGVIFEVATLFVLVEISIKLSSINKTLKKQVKLMEEEEVMFLEEDACDGDCLNCMCDESK